MTTFQTRDELITSFNKNMVICEIGVFKGDFSKFIKNEISPSELHLIDLFDGTTCSGDKDGNNVVWTNLSDEYVNLTNHFSNDSSVIMHKGKSLDVLNQFENDYFDLIYIDGDHTYEGVKSDLSVSFLKTKNGGLICGHDYTSDRFPGVVQAVNEFCQNNDLKIDYLTNDGCPTFCITNVKK
jgi:hypothetical protein